MLDKRLLTVASLVRKNSFVCDVGTDHAHLPCYLVLNNIVSYCVESDINKKPLESAKKNIILNGLEDKIELVLSDGLKNIPSHKAQDIIIAGMGGKLISDIILAVDYTKDKNKNFILQPMSQASVLRKQLYQNGFIIKKELPVIDAKHYYTIMQVKYEGVVKPLEDVFFWIGKMPENKTTEAQNYLKKQYNKALNITKGMENSNNKNESINYYKEIARQIKRHIKE